jgi:hypothetical protein
MIRRVKHLEREAKDFENICISTKCFLLPHLEDRETHSNLSADRSEHEEDANSSQEEEETVSKCSEKAKRNFIRGGTATDSSADKHRRFQCG